MTDRNLRKDLTQLLKEGQAHITVENALAGISASARNSRPAAMEHSIWEILEHMRIAQEDILRYTLDPNWVSPAFPQGYWPKNPALMTATDWNNTITHFTDDLNELIALIQDTSIDLTAEIPHTAGHTYLREILLVADHNAYHLGQIVQIRKVWGEFVN